MKLSQMVGKQLKEIPKQAVTPSHIYLVRGGYVRSVSAGIYSLLPLGQRICCKIESIIREEMNRIGGQEVKMPVVLPRELWEESGRYEAVGPELLRFQDRNGKDMLLGMTHEEAVVHLIRGEVRSYKQLPCMVYQIQTKYRDEARPRAGLIRVREFVMKDAYSFHTSEECLNTFYDTVHGAYERIFKRVGLKDVVSIQSDTGMMGGSVAHEFMALSPNGEDTIFMSPDRQYRANREVAQTRVYCKKEAPLPLERVHTPGQKTIAEVAKFLNVSTTQTGKAVFYRDHLGSLVFVVVRGDIEVNETKLKNHLKTPDISFASDDDIRAIGAEPGFASPMAIDATHVRVVVDHSVRDSSNLVVGANELDYHYKNFNFDRDMADLVHHIDVVDIATVRAGDPCPLSGQPLEMHRGIEVGNIFQLRTKYSAPMGATYLDRDGRSKVMIMGCYGIGVGRTMAAVIEQSHDRYGPIWPLAIAPYPIHMIALNRSQDAVCRVADTLYRTLSKKWDVLYDDRNEKAGVAFNDADLIGVPIRIIVSPKTVAAQSVEVKLRDGSRRESIGINQIAQYIDNLVAELTADA